MPARRHPRYAHAAAITVRAPGDVVISGLTKNVSKGGLCAEVAGAVPVGVDITVELTLIFDSNATSESLELPARVVWSTPLDDGFQLGIQFRPLNVRQSSYVDLFLEFLAARPDNRPNSDGSGDPFGG